MNISHYRQWHGGLDATGGWRVRAKLPWHCRD